MVSPISSLLTCCYDANCLLFYWRINVFFKISLPQFCIFLTDTGTAQLPMQLPLKQVEKSRIFHQLKMRCISGLKICLNLILFFSWLLTLKNESGDFSIGGWRKQRRKLSWKLTACFAKGNSFNGKEEAGGPFQPLNILSFCGCLILTETLCGHTAHIVGPAEGWVS